MIIFVDVELPDEDSSKFRNKYGILVAIIELKKLYHMAG